VNRAEGSPLLASLLHYFLTSAPPKGNFMCLALATSPAKLTQPVTNTSPASPSLSIACAPFRHQYGVSRVPPQLLFEALKWNNNSHPQRSYTDTPLAFLNQIEHNWRKRVGVEPTIRPAKDRIAGFEDRESHRTPFASAESIGVRRGQIQMEKRRRRRDCESKRRPSRRACRWCKPRSRSAWKARRFCRPRKVRGPALCGER